MINQEVQDARTAEVVTSTNQGETTEFSHDPPESSERRPNRHPQPPLPKWFPYWKHKPIYHGNGEALGWVMDSIGRSVAFAASAFLLTALLRLAKEEAGCETDPPPGSNKVPSCDGRVYGIRPSSLLTTFLVIVGIISAALLPFMGAIVDYTNKRLVVGQVTTVILCLLILPSLAISSKTWFPIALLQLPLAFVGWAQTLVTYAYLPELTDSEERLNQYTQSFTILSFIAMLLLIGGVVGVSSFAGFGDDEIDVARFGQAVSFVIVSAVLYPAWFRLFQPRLACQPLPQGRSLLTAGWRKVFGTSIFIYRNIPSLKWFYTSVSFVDAGVGSLATVMLTYLTDTLAFTTTENGITFMCFLVGSIPGAVIAGYTTSLWNPARSSIAATCLLAGTTIAAASVLEGPGQQMETYIFASVWGAAGGWKWTTDRVLASTLIPRNQDAELMGTYLFSGQILSWLPPLVFTGMNEAGLSQRVGIGVLSTWFLLGVTCLILIGDYRKAVAMVGREHMLLHQDSPEEEELSDFAQPLSRYQRESQSSSREHRQGHLQFKHSYRQVWEQLIAT
ncbi:hypothetical protein ACA910_004865 [Epithemia clementina (nom. ined.)]